MSFAKQRTSVFMNVQLTDMGRRLLSLGKLNFDKVIYSDREIDYKMGRVNYDLANNVVIAPPFSPPTYSAITNFDGTLPIPLTGKIKLYDRNVTGLTQSGFFVDMSAATYMPSIERDFQYRGGIVLSTSVNGTDDFLLNTSYLHNRGPWVGQFILARYTPPVGVPYPTRNSERAPHVYLWYRGIEKNKFTTFVPVDRNIPNFSTVGAQLSSEIFSYPASGISVYYGVSAGTSTAVWNLNIVRTSPEFGYMTGITSAHTSYASIEYNGMKHALGFDDNYRQVGFIHYTNAYTGKTFGNRLLEGAMEVSMPTIMWWRKPEELPGKCIIGGHKFLDKDSPVLYDGVAKTTYTELKDGTDSRAIVVGRVYQKLGLIVITDPELLTVMSYKSNRNWALPPLEATFTSQPAPPDTALTVSGLCQSGKTYLITYVAEYVNRFGLSGSNLISYGYQPSMHCGYITRMDYGHDSSGKDKFLRLTFPSRSLPYMRSGKATNTFSGTGWNANEMTILIKEVDSSGFTGVDNVVSTGWTRVSGNGTVSGNTISLSAYDMQAKQFVLSRSDYNAGSQYQLGEYFGNQFFHPLDQETLNLSGITYGSECFFFGDIKCGHVTSDHTMAITLELKNTEFNSSKNNTFDGKVDDSVYITDVGIFNENNVLVATAKPSYPIRKNQNRHVTMRLELIY